METHFLSTGAFEITLNGELLLVLILWHDPDDTDPPQVDNDKNVDPNPPVLTTSLYVSRRPCMVKASIWLRPKHPGDFSDPRQPHEDEPGGSQDLLLHLKAQVKSHYSDYAATVLHC